MSSEVGEYTHALFFALQQEHMHCIGKMRNVPSSLPDIPPNRRLVREQGTVHTYTQDRIIFIL